MATTTLEHTSAHRQPPARITGVLEIAQGGQGHLRAEIGVGNSSGTRREELLLSAAELTAVRGLRRALRSREGQANVEALLERMRATPDNATFLGQLSR